MFAVRVAAIPSASSQRAREGTGTRCRAAYSTTIDSPGIQTRTIWTLWWFQQVSGWSKSGSHTTGVARSSLSRDNWRQSSSENEHYTHGDVLQELSAEGLVQRRATGWGPPENIELA